MAEYKNRPLLDCCPSLGGDQIGDSMIRPFRTELADILCPLVMEVPMRFSVRPYSTLLLIIHICFLISPVSYASPRPNSTDILGSVPRAESNEQKTVEGEHERRKNEFLGKYVHLPPKDRIQLWTQAESARNVKGMYVGAQADMTNVLIAAGTDAVENLVQVIHSGSLRARVDAVRILCAMDRFVPANEKALPSEGASIVVEPLNLRGDVNPFLEVDGRRIGKEGYEAVRWAAEQMENNYLHFFARSFSGVLKQDLQQLPLERQFDTWRSAIIKARGLESVDDENYSVYWTLGNILIDKLPDSLPTLIRILDSDQDSYVREGAIYLIAQGDRCRMRLRGTEIGRRAIEEIHRALMQGNLQPVYRSKEIRENYWVELSKQFFDDEFRIDSTSTWALYARAFDQFYGAKTTITKGDGPWQLVEAKPDFRAFITFLTNVDANFPGWEYPYCGQSYYEVFHPMFRAKMDRYHEQWIRFQSYRRPETGRSDADTHP